MQPTVWRTTRLAISAKNAKAIIDGVVVIKKRNVVTTVTIDMAR